MDRSLKQAIRIKFEFFCCFCSAAAAAAARVCVFSSEGKKIPVHLSTCRFSFLSFDFVCLYRQRLVCLSLASLDWPNAPSIQSATFYVKAVYNGLRGEEFLFLVLFFSLVCFLFLASPSFVPLENESKKKKVLCKLIVFIERFV